MVAAQIFLEFFQLSFPNAHCGSRILLMFPCSAPSTERPPGIKKRCGVKSLESVYDDIDVKEDEGDGVVWDRIDLGV